VNRAASWTVLAVATLAVSTAGPFIRLAGMDAFAVVLLRMALAAPFFLAWASLRGGAGLPAGHAARVGLGGLLLGAHFLLWVKAFDLTSYASNLLLLIAQPVMAVPLGARIGERPTRATWIAVALALVGLGVIAQGDIALGPRALLGDACSVLAGFAITLFYVVTRRARAGMPIASFMGWTMVAGAAVALPVVLAAGSPVLAYPSRSWAWLAGLVLVTTLAGHGLMNLAARHLRLFTVNIAIVLEPAIAIAIGVLALHETVTLRQIAGGAVLAAAVVVALLPEWRSARQPALPPGVAGE